jgi:hypothetical protein
MEMNSPAVRPIAPSTHPALDLIALARLSPEEAGQRLRALLLGNPQYFGNVPLTSFHAVLNIQQDTTYECISCVAYDAQSKQLRATIDIKQTVGYSGVARIDGSEEFVRFFVSYDGGAKWLDQGMRSVSVMDGIVPRTLAYEVILQSALAAQPSAPKPQPRVRAILSWNAPPPAGAPDWTPVWGNVAESELQIKDSQVMGHVTAHALSSAKSDPRRLLAYLFARAARCSHTQISHPGCKGVDSQPCDVAAPAFLLPTGAEARSATAL